jgi:hypothetical protein
MLNKYLLRDDISWADLALSVRRGAAFPWRDAWESLFLPLSATDIAEISQHTPFRAFQWLVTLWIDRTGPTWSRPRYTLSLQMALEQPLLAHTSLMICLQTYVPNPPFQLFLWKETRTTRRKPMIFGRALNFTHFTWGLGSSHIEKFSLRFERWKASALTTSPP